MCDVERRQICKIHCNLCRFVAKSVVHAVLSRNFMWRKIEPKSTFVEKKWQISALLSYLMPTLFSWHRHEQASLFDPQVWSSTGFEFQPQDLLWLQGEDVSILFNSLETNPQSRKVDISGSCRKYNLSTLVIVPALWYLHTDTNFTMVVDMRGHL